jgi:hypothetical protein
LVDPLIIRILALGFAVLFLLAAIHKLGNRVEFLQILGAYKVLPPLLLRPAALIIPNLEIAIGTAWLLMGLFGFQLRAVPAISAGLLVMYACAIGINLIRGRTDIHCGCSFSSAKTEKNKSTDHISGAQVWRNGLLALLSLVALMPATARAINGLDGLALIAATIVCVLMYAAMNQLIANNHNMKPWLNKTRNLTDG